jgi:hypothetical protein
MSSNASAILDMAELAKDLPSLIVETNIENQVANIEKWLKPIMPVNGIALSLSGSSQSNGSIFGINIQENEMRNIERLLLENLAVTTVLKKAMACTLSPCMRRTPSFSTHLNQSQAICHQRLTGLPSV